MVQRIINTRKQSYKLTRMDIGEINSILTRLGLRLDKLDAIGLNPDMKGRIIKNLGGALKNSDAVRKDQVLLLTDFNERVDDRVANLLNEGRGIDIEYNDAEGALVITVDFGNFTTDDLKEGSNLYFTNERVDDRVAALLTEGTVITLTYNDAANTLTIDVKIKSDNGIGVDANGLYVKLKSGYGIDVDSNGLKLKQQSAVPDASAVSAISLGAGADTVDMATFNTDLGSLVTEINSIKDTLNTIIARLEGAEILST